MDKYNIITPTDNLNDLTNDMINWYQMPKKFRDAANDDCMRIYNCYVPQLYNRIKEKILQNMDKIAVTVSGNDKIAKLMEDNSEQIQKVCLADSILQGEAKGFVKEWDINGEKVSFGVEKI